MSTSGMFSTSGGYHDECEVDAMSIPGMFSTLEGYHEYTGGYNEYIG